MSFWHRPVALFQRSQQYIALHISMNSHTNSFVPNWITEFYRILNTELDRATVIYCSRRRFWNMLKGNYLSHSILNKHVTAVYERVYLEVSPYCFYLIHVFVFVCKAEKQILTGWLHCKVLSWAKFLFEGASTLNVFGHHYPVLVCSSC